MSDFFILYFFFAFVCAMCFVSFVAMPGPCRFLCVTQKCVQLSSDPRHINKHSFPMNAQDATHKHSSPQETHTRLRPRRSDHNSPATAATTGLHTAGSIWQQVLALVVAI